MLSNRSDLVEVTLEHCGIGNVLGRLGKLEQNHAGANLQETHDDRGNGRSSALEALEQDGRSNNSGTSEENVIRRRDQRGVIDIESFLSPSCQRYLQAVQHFFKTYIEVNDLCQKRGNHKNQDNVKEPLVEL